MKFNRSQLISAVPFFTIIATLVIAIEDNGISQKSEFGASKLFDDNNLYLKNDGAHANINIDIERNKNETENGIDYQETGGFTASFYYKLKKRAKYFYVTMLIILEFRNVFINCFRDIIRVFHVISSLHL
jgi:hypothetical protein